MKPEEIWHQASEKMETRVNKQTHDTWFKPLSIESVEGKEVTLVAPNRFFCEWIREHYYEMLLDEIGRITKIDGLRINLIIKNGEQTPTESPISEKTGRSRRGIQLNAKYTFGGFVVGSCNQFAHAAALAVAESPARAYNPLFLYGGVGLGKTHLLNAIGNFIIEKRPGTRIAYLSSEQFTNEVINSIRYDKMLEFRNKYRGVDTLLMDDIQFIAGKERTQEEFFHTFNALYEAHKQIVLSSDRFPKEIPTIEERLRSRFEWGLIADLQVPDLETRIAILRKKAETEAIDLPDAVAHLLAENIRGNVRELEGALIRVGAFSSLTGQAITLDLAKKILRDSVQVKKILTAEEIQRVVAERFHLRQVDMKSKKRTKTIVQPRQITMYLCRELTSNSFPEIGRHFGGKDHTTVIHACRQIEKRMEADASFKQLVESITRQLQEGQGSA
ncbi:MAG TPA: chromosomal replication initiator protein DnaA [Nitrospiria bacterium]|nr:chromosomal replication initiator protein DnaA [Nitrospiria bacterium]